MSKLFLIILTVALLLSIGTNITFGTALRNIYLVLELKPGTGLVDTLIEAKTACERKLPRNLTCKLQIIAEPKEAVIQ